MYGLTDSAGNADCRSRLLPANRCCEREATSIYFIHAIHRLRRLIVQEGFSRLEASSHRSTIFYRYRGSIMKSFHPTSSNSAQSNILPFTPNSRSLRFKSTAARPAQPSMSQRFWDWLYAVMMPTSAPKITQKRDRKGQEYYQVYDPISGRTQTFGSELETRIWLDQRFYQ